MAIYKSEFTGEQIDFAVRTVLNRKLPTLEIRLTDGAIYLNNLNDILSTLGTTKEIFDTYIYFELLINGNSIGVSPRSNEFDNGFPIEQFVEYEGVLGANTVNFYITVLPENNIPVNLNLIRSDYSNTIVIIKE